MVSYCAQGQFKRNLKEIGFEIETLPGAMEKWELVRAQKDTQENLIFIFRVFLSPLGNLSSQYLFQRRN